MQPIKGSSYFSRYGREKKGLCSICPQQKSGKGEGKNKTRLYQEKRLTFHLNIMRLEAASEFNYRLIFYSIFERLRNRFFSPQTPRLFLKEKRTEILA